MHIGINYIVFIVFNANTNAMLPYNWIVLVFYLYKVLFLQNYHQIKKSIKIAVVSGIVLLLYCRVSLKVL